MENFKWDLMVGQLRGIQFNNYGLNQLAQLQVGEVKECKEYLKLSERLDQND